MVAEEDTSLPENRSRLQPVLKSGSVRGSDTLRSLGSGAGGRKAVTDETVPTTLAPYANLLPLAAPQFLPGAYTAFFEFRSNLSRTRLSAVASTECALLSTRFGLEEYLQIKSTAR